MAQNNDFNFQHPESLLRTLIKKLKFIIEKSQTAKNIDEITLIFRNIQDVSTFLAHYEEFPSPLKKHIGENVPDLRDKITDLQLLCSLFSEITEDEQKKLLSDPMFTQFIPIFQRIHDESIKHKKTINSQIKLMGSETFDFRQSLQDITQIYSPDEIIYGYFDTSFLSEVSHLIDKHVKEIKTTQMILLTPDRVGEEKTDKSVRNKHLFRQGLLQKFHVQFFTQKLDNVTDQHILQAYAKTKKWKKEIAEYGGPQAEEFVRNKFLNSADMQIILHFIRTKQKNAQYKCTIFANDNDFADILHILENHPYYKIIQNSYEVIRIKKHLGHYRMEAA